MKKIQYTYLLTLFCFAGTCPLFAELKNNPDMISLEIYNKTHVSGTNPQ